MAALTIVEPEIELYQDGFEGVCTLDRAGEGRKLSSLLETVSEPLVVALDGPWGSGKSFFLRCWVGAHTKENKGEALTVYFDAFKHDFTNDPLIALTAAISDRLGSKRNSKVWAKVKDSAYNIALPVGRVAFALATAGVSELTGPVIDAGLQAGADESKSAAENFWEKEKDRRAAMRAFRSSLQQLASDMKIVIVVDELDRCRPDYALNLLEVIKHFFDVKNVHFVLGANINELANSVKARYGANINGHKYLQKFITVTMPLVAPRTRSTSLKLQIKHLRSVAEKLDLRHSSIFDGIEEYIKLVDHHVGLSLRDVEKVCTLALVSPLPTGRVEANLHLYVGCLIIKIVAPEAFEAARVGKLSQEDVYRIFNIREKPSSDSFERTIHTVWTLASSDYGADTRSYLTEGYGKLFKSENPREVLRNVIAESFDTFRLLE